MGLASTEQRRRAGQVELIRRRYGLHRNKRCLAVHTAAGRPNQALTDDDLSSEGRVYSRTERCVLLQWHGQRLSLS